MGGENSAGALRTMCRLKEKDTTKIISIMTSAIHQQQHKLPPDLSHAFMALNNGTNTSHLTSTNVSKLTCVIHFNTLFP